ncbi:unnamed protein product [Thlaspi arvense]|uniref:RNase H type-1 domain-containing protein n=1 Tax=Thlaspi arvense TaxID=13288 RepID=A0AAU9SNP9_THLAR|nr:unnamed protein product [Thlaspi arvense]
MHISNRKHPSLSVDMLGDLEGSGLARLEWTITHAASGLKVSGSDSCNNSISALQAEDLALLAAIQHAKTLGLNTVSAFSDSQELIKIINSVSNYKDLHGIGFDIQAISHSFSSILFYHVLQKDNQETDSLAKNALSSFGLNSNRL